MRKKIILVILLFLFTLIFPKIIYGDTVIKLKVGETYIVKADAMITSTTIGDETIISYEKDGNYKRIITAKQLGTTTFKCSTFAGQNDINLTIKVIKSAEEERLEELESAYKKAEPGENDNYSDVAKWVYSDNTYNESKQLKELAKTDEGIKKMQIWENEMSRHIRGGSDTTDPVYLARTILQDLIKANKDSTAIDNATDKNKENGNKVTETIIAKIKAAQGESREERGNLFTNDVLENIDQYKPNDIDSASAGKIETATSKILTVISNIGIAVSVIMLAILGIKYMIGSVEERAEYKKGLVPYVIGAFILFGVTTFVKILMTFGDKIANI